MWTTFNSRGYHRKSAFAKRCHKATQSVQCSQLLSVSKARSLRWPPLTSIIAALFEVAINRNTSDPLATLSLALQKQHKNTTSQKVLKQNHWFLLLLRPHLRSREPNNQRLPEMCQPCRRPQEFSFVMILGQTE